MLNNVNVSAGVIVYTVSSYAVPSENETLVKSFVANTHDCASNVDAVLPDL